MVLLHAAAYALHEAKPGVVKGCLKNILGR